MGKNFHGEMLIETTAPGLGDSARTGTGGDA
jgi:hypothetical protein